MVLVLDDTIEVDEDTYELRRHGQVVPLEPQAFDVLVHLVHHRDRVVPKEELMDAVWGGRFVSETAVTSRIKQVRRALGDDGRTQRLLRTVHGRGYRLVADVQERLASPVPVTAVPQPPSPATPGPPRSPIRYTVSDGLHIAYQVTGGGARDIVLIPGFVSHLDLDWEDTRYARFLDRLGSLGRLIRFDKRGTGMSDRPSGLPDLETRMHDVLAVMDAVGSERALLCGYSEGGPMALLMAAMHPERVAGLVLYGSYARRTRAPDYPWTHTDEQRARYVETLVTGWDWEADLLMRCPSGDEAMQAWWGRRMRAAATPGTIRALLEMNSLVDVRELLPTVRTPTLVLHRVDDRLLPVEGARYLAERIPDATLLELPGADHLPCGDPDQILDAIEPFVTALPRPEHHFALAAVAAAAGVDAAQALAALEDAGGRRRRSAYDGTVTLFDGPATAVRAALGAVAGLEATVGVSIAEVAVGDGPATGPAVELAVELARSAPSGQVLVSSVAGALLAGSGIPVGPYADVRLPSGDSVTAGAVSVSGSG